ncbi:MAG: NUDIX domain-containing protein [Rhodoplanes sp.]
MDACLRRADRVRPCAHPPPRGGGGEPPIAGKLAQPVQAWLRWRWWGRPDSLAAYPPPPCCAQSPTANHTDFLPNKEHEIIWHRVPGVVRHVFTHFPLELFVFVADAPGGLAAPAGMRWTPLADLDGEALSNLMRKVLAHALAEGRVKIVEAERATVTAAPRAPRRAARRSR